MKISQKIGKTSMKSGTSTENEERAFISEKRRKKFEPPINKTSKNKENRENYLSQESDSESGRLRKMGGII